MSDPASIHQFADPVEDVIQRVWRRFENEVAEDHQGTSETARHRVGGWLAGVSFDEWFALVDAYREAQSEALSIPVRACVFPTRNEGE